MAKNKVKKKKQRKHPKFWLGFKIFILLFLVALLVAGIIFYVMYGRDIFAAQDQAIQLVKNSTLETFRSSETSIAYNSKGKQIAVLKGDKDSYYLPIDEIPEYVQDAFVVTEDKKFYSHNGIDAEGIIRAVWVQIQNKGEISQGASTITQQLARGIFLTTEKTSEKDQRNIYSYGAGKEIQQTADFRVLSKQYLFFQWLLWYRSGGKRVFQCQLQRAESVPALFPLCDSE